MAQSYSSKIQTILILVTIVLGGIGTSASDNPMYIPVLVLFALIMILSFVSWLEQDKHKSF